MNKKRSYYLLFWAWITFGSVQAQVGSAVQIALDQIIPAIELPATEVESTAVPRSLPSPISPLLVPKIPASYNYDHLGVFCKFEVQLEKKFKIPMKIRLGEVQYTEQLEYGPR